MTASQDSPALWNLGELAGAIRDRRISSRELLGEYLRRVEAINPALNAVVTIDAERALDAGSPGAPPELVVHADEPPPLAPNQGSTPLAWWDLDGGARSVVLASGPEALARYQVARAEWKLMTAAALVGLTERALGIAVDFAKTRETMGVPIGMLQGVAFPLADVAIGISGAQNCQYAFLITRTDPDLPKHRGLTMFLVPLATQGIEIQAIRTYGGERTNIVYYSDVRISDRYRLGGVNDGWSVPHGPLDEEHGVGRDSSVKLADLSIGTSFLSVLGQAIDSALDWACTTIRADGSRPVEDRMVRYRLGLVALHMEAGLVTPGPMGRVKGSEALVRGAAALMDLVGPASLLSEGSPGADLTGAIDYAHRFAQGTATYGGTVEVFHGIIAQHVLGLPRPSYPGSKTLVSRKREQAAA